MHAPNPMRHIRDILSAHDLSATLITCVFWIPDLLQSVESYQMSPIRQSCVDLASENSGFSFFTILFSKLRTMMSMTILVLSPLRLSLDFDCAADFAHKIKTREIRIHHTTDNRQKQMVTQGKDMIQVKLPLTVEDANVTKVERKIPARDKLKTVGRGAPGGDPFFDASLGMEHATGEYGPSRDSRRTVPLTHQDANVSNMDRRVPIITDKFTIEGLRGLDCDDDVLMLDASKTHRQEDAPNKGTVRKLPLTVDDTNVGHVERRLPNAVPHVHVVGGDPILEASMAQRTGPRGGVIRKLPMTVSDARVSAAMERRTPPPQNTLQNRGEPVGDPLLDAYVEEQEDQGNTTTDEDTATHLDVRHKMKSKFPATKVVGPEDVHREVGPPKA